MTAPRLHFENVEFRADKTALLGPVSLTLNSPGITVIMGPNGAGKSLFLYAAHGLLGRHSGAVTWNDIPAQTSRGTRGFVFQTTPILRRSVAGNIAFALHARGLSRHEKSARVAQALTEARLDADPGKPAATLSGGERRRLALARAIVTEPETVLLDEPSANLDPASTAALEEVLRRISASGTKILLSTHDIAQARRLAGDILFFDEGALVEQADAKAFFAGPTSPAAQKYLKGEL